MAKLLFPASLWMIAVTQSGSTSWAVSLFWKRWSQTISPHNASCRDVGDIPSVGVLILKEMVTSGELLFPAFNVNDHVDEVLKQSRAHILACANTHAYAVTVWRVAIATAPCSCSTQFLSQSWCSLYVVLSVSSYAREVFLRAVPPCCSTCFAFTSPLRPSRRPISTLLFLILRVVDSS